MNENPKTEQLDDWDACDAGELRQLVWRLKAHRRNQQMLRIGGLTVALLLCVSVGVFAWHKTQEMQQLRYGGISCQEVQQHMPEYSRRQLEPELASRIRVHLAKCPHCQSLQPSAVSQRPAVADRDANPDVRRSWYTPLAVVGVVSAGVSR